MPATQANPQASERANAHASPVTDLVPGWLALLVLILLLAVAALGGYLIRGALTASKSAEPAGYVVEDLEQDVAEDPNDPEAILALGYAYQIDGRYEDALAAYDSVLAIDPENSGALFNSGVVLMETDRPKEGEAALWKVLESHPDHALAAKALGEYYISKEQFKSALVALEPVIELKPEYADLQYLAGYSSEQLGITGAAIEYYRGALTFNTDYQEARDGLVRLGVTEQEQ